MIPFPGAARSVRRAVLMAWLWCLSVGAGALAQPPDVPLPILDVHLHAPDVASFLRLSDSLPTTCRGDQDIQYPGVDPSRPITLARVKSCPEPLVSVRSEEQLIRETVEILDRRNIWAITMGAMDRLAGWRAASPGRILAATDFGEGREPMKDLEVLRRLVATGQIVAFGEIDPQYDGRGPDHPSLEPYFALAEELDVPVGVHLGEGPTGGAHVLGAFGSPSPYRVAAGRPLLLEEVLVRHPRLRLWVMHFGSPFLDEMVAMLYSHPQLYVDVAQNDWGFPRGEFHRHLRRLVEAGFGRRILFGSDQMVWPETIEIAINSIESADFLTDQQKRDILYHNAARFLRLSQEEIARHHSGLASGDSR